jgi:hypothetical protein
MRCKERQKKKVWKKEWRGGGRESERKIVEMNLVALVIHNC